MENNVSVLSPFFYCIVLDVNIDFGCVGSFSCTKMNTVSIFGHWFELYMVDN